MYCPCVAFCSSLCFTHQLSFPPGRSRRSLDTHLVGFSLNGTLPTPHSAGWERFKTAVGAFVVTVINGVEDYFSGDKKLTPSAVREYHEIWCRSSDNVASSLPVSVYLRYSSIPLYLSHTHNLHSWSLNLLETITSWTCSHLISRD